MMISRDEGPDAPTDDDLRDCPHCTASNSMVPQVKPSLVTEDNPQRYECVGCGYNECDHRLSNGASAYRETYSGQVCTLCDHFVGNWET